MEKRRHYWNGRWGRLARHDVLVFENGGQWTVESRIGGVEGRTSFYQYDDEAGATTRVATLLSTGDGWREL